MLPCFGKCLVLLVVRVPKCPARDAGVAKMGVARGRTGPAPQKQTDAPDAADDGPRPPIARQPETGHRVTPGGRGRRGVAPGSQDGPFVARPVGGRPRRRPGRLPPRAVDGEGVALGDAVGATARRPDAGNGRPRPLVLPARP